MPRKAVVVLLVLGLLTGISAIQQLRQSGLGEIDPAGLSASPLAGIGELGGTLRTVVVVIAWQDLNSADLRFGATYWAPVDRVVSGRLLGQPIPRADADLRLLNVEMRHRETTIGASFIAEAYRNFALLGSVLIGAAFGTLLALFDRRRRSVFYDAFVGVVLVALLHHIRNSFTPVPAQIVGGVLIICVAYVLASFRSSSH